MSAPSEAVLEKVGSWLRHGDQDLALARHALVLGADFCRITQGKW
jgi:hypothetical protein